MKVRVIVDAEGKGKTFIDGHDISSGVVGVEISTYAGNIPTVRLTLLGDEIDVDMDGVSLSWIKQNFLQEKS